MPREPGWTLEQLQENWIGTTFSLRIYRSNRSLLAELPNRGTECEPPPVTTDMIRQRFGPGRYRVVIYNTRNEAEHRYAWVAV